MKMVALPSGKQRCIHGPAVNVPSRVDSVCSVLPRLPSRTELVPLKFKQKLSYSHCDKILHLAGQEHGAIALRDCTRAHGGKW